MVIEEGYCGAGIDETSQEDTARWDDLCCECQFPYKREKLAFRTSLPRTKGGELLHEEGELLWWYTCCLGHCVKLDAKEGDTCGGRCAFLYLCLNPQLGAEGFGSSKAISASVGLWGSSKKEIIQVVYDAIILKLCSEYVL